MTRTLLVAAGGGGDALAALFVARAQSVDGGRPVIATYSWDRYLLDPQPGPRTPADFQGLSQITPSNWEVLASSRLLSGARSTIPILARYTAARFVLLDPRNGAAGIRAQLGELAAATSATRIMLVDVGGDITAHGHEPELLSPLADSMTLAALDGLEIPSQVAVAGPGLDGELAAATVRQRCAQIGARTTRLLPVHVEPFLTALDHHPSEATTLLAAATLGIRGQAEIRDTAALVPVDDQSATIQTAEHQSILKINEIAQKMTTTRSLDEAENVTIAIRQHSELTHERRKAQNQPRNSAAPEPAELASRYARYRHDAISRGVSLLTFRRLAEVIGLRDYDPSIIRSLAGPDAHPHLAICQLSGR